MENGVVENKRGGFSSKFGFIMAAVGSAVGLGNIWRFPYIAAQYGGALFLIVYLAIVFLLGFPMIALELSIGRRAKKSVAAGAYKANGKNFSFIGWINLATCFLIAAFYVVIGGWVLKYFLGYATGGGFVSGGNYDQIFNTFISGSVTPVIFTVVFVLACLAVLVMGVKKGIEKASKILMPALFVILIFVMVSSLFMDNAIEGVKFFLVPNLERLEQNGGIFGLINAAMGQAFFSLSLGMGINVTYGSYLKKETKIARDSIIICLFDTLIAVMAGFATIPAVFSAGLSPSQGAGLLFVSLPAVFASLNWFGVVLGILFFVLVLIAALTSVISVFEVIISSFLELVKGAKRLAVTALVGAAVLVAATLVSVSQSGVLGINFLELFDLITVKFMLPPAALLVCIFATFVIKKNGILEEIFGSSKGESLMRKTYGVSVTVICPILIFLVFVFGLISLNFSALFF